MTIRTNFLKCFAVLAQISTANFCHQCGQQLHLLNQVTNKAASSVDREKLLNKYFHRGYPYAALIMCTSECGSGCFKVSISKVVRK